MVDVRSKQSVKLSLQSWATSQSCNLVFPGLLLRFLLHISCCFKSATSYLNVWGETVLQDSVISLYCKNLSSYGHLMKSVGATALLILTPIAVCLSVVAILLLVE